jgi:hypothetical protein
VGGLGRTGLCVKLSYPLLGDYPRERLTPSGMGCRFRVPATYMVPCEFKQSDSGPCGQRPKGRYPWTSTTAATSTASSGAPTLRMTASWRTAHCVAVRSSSLRPTLPDELGTHRELVPRRGISRRWSHGGPSGSLCCRWPWRHSRTGPADCGFRSGTRPIRSTSDTRPVSCSRGRWPVQAMSLLPAL